MKYTEIELKAIELFKEYLSGLIECEYSIDYTDYHMLYEIYSEYENDLNDRVEYDEQDENSINDLNIIENVCFSDISDFFVVETKEHYTTYGEFNINNFTVEVTRNCNIECAHCLRGCAENKNIDIELLKNFVNNIGLNYINNLTIGGGESGCNENLTSDIIKFFAGASNLTYGNSFIVLNGAKEYSFDFIKSLILFENEAHEKESNGTAFSYDNFHTVAMSEQQIKNRDKNFNNLKSYGLNVQKHTDGASYGNPESLIKMGRSLDGRELKPNCLDESEIYFTVDGLLFSSCNLSYNEMSKKEDSIFFICDTKNITCEDDLKQAFENYETKIANSLQD